MGFGDETLSKFTMQTKGLNPSLSLPSLLPTRRLLGFHSRIQQRQQIPSSINRRAIFTSLILCNFPLPSTLPDFILHNAHAQENEERVKEKYSKEENNVLGGVLSIFDTNGKTKSGRVLPKKYLENANDVVKNLRNTMNEDPKDTSKFRRSADSAKDSIKGFLKDWTADKSITSEESYTALLKAIRLLADFYSRKGPTAVLSEDVKSKITSFLDTAENAL